MEFSRQGEMTEATVGRGKAKLFPLQEVDVSKFACSEHMAQALCRRREGRGGNGVKNLNGSEVNLLDPKKIGGIPLSYRP